MSELEPVVIELNTSDNKSEVKLNNDPKPSVNFGGGIELLMNDKKRSSSPEMGLGELSDLENELNNLTTDINTKTTDISKSNAFNTALNNIIIEDKKDDKPITIEKEVNLGEQTAQNINNNKTWDGFTNLH